MSSFLSPCCKRHTNSLFLRHPPGVEGGDKVSWRKHLPLYGLCDVLNEKRRNREVRCLFISRSLSGYTDNHPGLIIYTGFLYRWSSVHHQQQFSSSAGFANQHPSLTQDKLTSLSFANTVIFCNSNSWRKQEKS